MWVGGVGWSGVGWETVVTKSLRSCASQRKRCSEMGFSLSMSTINIFESRYEFKIDDNWCILGEVSLKCKLMMVYSDKWWMRKCPARYARRVTLVSQRHLRQ